MSEFIINFHFLRPWILLLLIIPLLFLGRYFKGKSNQSSWEKVCDKKLLAFLLVKGSSTQRKLVSLIGFIGIVLGIIAAAGPSWKKIEIPALLSENPLMAVLNLSMDMDKKDITPSRIERAKFLLKDFWDESQGAQTGLIVYSSEPFLISPLTEDSRLLTNLLSAVGTDIMPANGDRADRAIDLAVEKMLAAGYNQGQIVLFALEEGQRFDLAIEAAKKAVKKGFTVNVIGMDETSEKLKMVASAGNGFYQNIRQSDKALKMLIDNVSSQKSELKEGKNTQSVWLDYGWYLMFLPLCCCLYFFRQGILVVMLVLFSSPVYAGFFINNNQEGLVNFNNQDYQRAQEKFSDANWKAASFYRMGDYEKALREYQKTNDVTGLYNQGNALAKSGKIDEAIKKYEEVLQQQPNHEDAKFNLEYLKRQQNQQQNQQSQQNQQQPSDNNEENDNDNQGDSGSGNKGDDNQESPQDDEGQEKNQDNSSQPQDNQSGNNSQSNQKQNGQDENNGDQSPSSSSQTSDGANDGQNPMPGEEPQPFGGEEKEQEGASASGGAEEGDKGEYDEQLQARAQQYREIPEDIGGLLREFIYREYNRNRYQDN